MLRDLSRNKSLIEDAIYRGGAYRSHYETALAASTGVAYLSITIGAARTTLFSRILSANRADVRYEVMSGAVVSGYSAALPIYGLNQDVVRASANTIRPCTVSNPGVPVDIDVVRGTSGQGNRTNGGTFDPGNDLRIFKPNQEIVIRLLNTDTEAANALIYYKWIESTP